jgi:acetate kinase
MGTRPGALDSGVGALSVSDARLSRARGRDDALQEVGLLGISASATTCAICSRARPGARLAVDYFVYRAAKEIGALPPSLGGIDGSCSPPASASARPRSASESAMRPRGSGSSIDRDANERHGPRLSAPGSAVEAWVVPTNEELVIARHTGSCLID